MTLNRNIMDEIIEVIVDYAAKRSEGFTFGEQSFIFTEVSERLTALSHDALMAEYGLREEDFE